MGGQFAATQGGQFAPSQGGQFAATRIVYCVFSPRLSTFFIIKHYPFLVYLSKNGRKVVKIRSLRGYFATIFAKMSRK
ncbi:MAG: hypothetical protein A2W93_00315 [Bacteroidetes bacterium GWF2_43_63]|nr:MAG: hypothetical protein A2W94_13205 [Bacteroidetes bacterium GWE2_42_42]OFY53849.1 MAG: hypothetical protein A2W93_00315 [Bacteroidetes bacterium GWF2_43_63]HBG69807.1 hypothetical protein [Bacteroidales bacterium]HCB60995.1 hypothetical protein [Bacteroidales bacterium]HCY24551.1 hypothetical protein [Bacteroidales bacterium]